ncbi:MAG: hypothetical protein ABJA66_21275 [Actinomycetota bacterium]
MADESKISFPENASLTQDTGFQGYQPKEVVVPQPKTLIVIGIHSEKNRMEICGR